MHIFYIHIYIFMACRKTLLILKYYSSIIKVKWSRYRLGVAQRMGRGIALLFHDRGTRRGWVVSSKPRPHFTRGKDPVPILQEAGWAPGPVWTGGITRPGTRSRTVQPPVSRYTDWATGPTHEFYFPLSIKLKEISISLIHPLAEIVSTKFYRKYRWYPHYLFNLLAPELFS